MYRIQKGRKKMKKVMKKLLLVFAMIFAVSCIQATAQAKTTKIKLYVGEEISYYYIGIGTLNSVKSSNSKVVSAKLKNSRCNMVAKKAGTSTVTSKGSRGTFVHKVTVKKPSFKISAARFNYRYAKITIKNNNGSCFDSLKVLVTFKDKNGKKLYSDIAYMYTVCPKQTANYSVYLGSNYENVDLSKTTYKVQMSRNPDYKYSNYGKKVSFSEKQSVKGSSTYIDVTSKTSYKGKGTITVRYDALFYNAEGKLVYISNYGTTLYKNSSKKTTSILMPYNATSYKIVKRAMLSEY